MTAEHDNTQADSPESTNSALDRSVVTEPFPLTPEGVTAPKPEFSADRYIDDCIDQLSSNVDYHYGTYRFDGGALGELEIEIDDLEIDLQDVVRDNWCGSAPDWTEYVSDESAEPVCATLAGVRAAWMAHTGRTIEDYLWVVTVEAMRATRDAEATVGLELVEASGRQTLQAEQDRDKAQAEYGKADRDRQRLEADLKWAAEVIGTLQVAEPIRERAAGLMRVIEETEKVRREALAVAEAQAAEPTVVEEAQA